MTPQNTSVSSVCPKKGTIQPQHSLVDQGGLMHTGNSSAEQQREMFVSSEHTQTDIIMISFYFKNKNYSIYAAVNFKHIRWNLL